MDILDASTHKCWYVKLTHIHLVAFLLLSSLVRPACTLNQRLVDGLTHYSSPTVELQHFFVHKDTGNIYLGGTNRLYHLSSNLSKISEVDTKDEGTRHFCPSMSGRHRCPLGENTNRLLRVDYGQNLLVACGSDFWGTCSLHDPGNITNVVGWPARVVDGNGGLGEDSIALSDSIIGYYAPFQAGDGGLLREALYIGATFNSDSLYVNISQHAAVAKTLSLSREWHFTFAYQDRSYNRNPFIDIKGNYKHSYKVRYVHGFGHEGFNYMTTVQRNDVDDSRYGSRIIRICNRDKSFYSYTEMSLVCKDSSNVAHNILQAAFLGQAGANFDYPPGEAVLYAVFSRSVSDTSDQPGDNSVLCMYKMSYINTRIRKGLQDCLSNAEGSQGLKFMSDNRLCSEAIYNNVGEDFCGTADLQPIESQRSAIRLDVLGGGGVGKSFTAIAAMPLADSTLAIVGTRDGNVMKFLLQPPDASNNVPVHLPHKDLDLSDDPILSDMIIDAAEDNVYVLTTNEIFKIAISTCEHYIDCSVCVVTSDPNNCGWCGFCTTEAICLEQGGPATWNKTNCPPAIYDVTPLAGPLEGSTQLTITGDNLGNNVAGSYTHEVHVAGIPCVIREEMSEIFRIVCVTSPVASPTSGPVVAKIEVFDSTWLYRVNGSIISDFIFEYLDPVISGFSPDKGGISGGTEVTVTGNGLNAANVITVTVAGRPCSVESATMTTLTCVTTPTTQPQTGQIHVDFDGIITKSSADLFAYIRDAILESFSPNKAVVSGGQTISMFGVNLHLVKEARMDITVPSIESTDGTLYQSDCNYVADVQFVCLSPNISQSAAGITATEPITATVAFFLDDVPTTLISSGSNSSVFSFYPDPVFYKFGGSNGVVTVAEGSRTLTITGTNMNLALGTSDMQITIGGRECPVVDLKIDQLTCEIPDLQEATKGQYGYKVELVALASPTSLGYMKINPSPFPWYAIFVPVCLILSIIVVLVIYRTCKQTAQPADQPDLAGTFTPAVLFQRQTSSVHGGESAEARVLPALFRTNNYLRTPSSSAESAFLGTNEENRPLMQTINKDLAMQISEVLINEDNLTRGSVVGQGNFGCVFHGKLWQDGSAFEVAIKSLLPGTSEEVSNFLREGIMMKDFKHPHVLQLIGVCIDSKNLPLVILPFMKHGDLLKYIRNAKNELTARDLLEFSRQIADGMAYLSNLKFVHRDLAARNCMLDENFSTKIADFGLSRDIFERDYYSAKDKTAKLPVRWMALECLERSIYSTKTDVWSFGVVMWELLTRGMSPYPSVENWDVSVYLQRGRRLQQPMHCPGHVYEIMMNCWSLSPVDRPTFDDLTGQLTAILLAAPEQQTPEDQIYLNLIPQIT